MASRAVEAASGVPALAPERAVTWPKRTGARLSNGLEVILAEARSIPKFHGELFFRSGNAAVADRAPGLAEMTATVARTGTMKRASRQIEEDLRRIGADLSSAAGADTSAISFAGLSEFAEPLLVLVNELASEAQVAAYRREDLLAVYREFYTPQNGILLLVGDFDAQEMLKAAEKVFGAWAGKKPEAAAAPAPANPRGRQVYLVHVPGAVQTQILAGCHAITRKHPDWVKLGLTNSLYGG